MSETKLKICGLQDVEVLKSMIQLPVDYIGLVFAESRRKISVGQASEIVSLLDEWNAEPAPKAAGVFVNPGLSELREIMAEVGLSVIQLHGAESPSFCLEIKRAFPGVEVWKALAVSSEAGGMGPGPVLESYAGTVDAVLLDTYDPAQAGGSGRTFAWELIPAYRERAQAIGVPLFVAGGLTPENVGGLLENYAPDGVDVSSGVEREGIKDIAKIRAFTERVKQS